jgi:hypothetical protein
VGRISFQKRQKEMKRQEKQQMKAEKRAQRKLAKNAEAEAAVQQSDLSSESVDPVQEPSATAEAEPQS